MTQQELHELSCVTYIVIHGYPFTNTKVNKPCHNSKRELERRATTTVSGKDNCTLKLIFWH